MGKVDGLSRQLDWKVGVDKDNENQVFIKDNWICSLQEAIIERPEVEILEKIKKARSKNKDVVRIVEEMKKAKVKELQGNKWQIEMLGIEMKLLTAFYLQTDGQTKQINQELEQYLRFFVDHRQKNWLEQLASAEFAVNNKVHTATKVLPFMANYGRELRMGGDIRKREKVESATKFVERMKKVYKEAGVTLKKTQEDMRRQADK